MGRRYVISCHVLGGRSPKTGKPVGQRHRWSEGDGKGRCDFCGRTFDEVLTPKTARKTRSDKGRIRAVFLARDAASQAAEERKS
ncbi:hypothetical protein PCO31111_04526 [Pandoraea communis]|uniref:Uncharacterized protein n=1 Tax=Pandoraea communis TaxID=2508297 RepID=A0A5E4YGR3_9BURK|nr:hypothetical protein PCO31111_04526 [Pandoraea communis]